MPFEHWTQTLAAWFTLTLSPTPIANGEVFDIFKSVPVYVDAHPALSSQHLVMGHFEGSVLLKKLYHPEAITDVKFLASWSTVKVVSTPLIFEILAPVLAQYDFCWRVNLSCTFCTAGIVTADPESCWTVHCKQRLFAYPATTFCLALTLTSKELAVDWLEGLL